MNTVLETGGTKFVGRLGLFFGGIVLLVGIAIGINNWLRYSSMQRVEGVVVKYERDKGMKGFSPHVRYTVGEQVYFAGAHGNYEAGQGVRRGDKVGVFYAEGRPEVGYLDLFNEKWFNPLLVTFVGIVMSTIAAVLRFGPTNKVIVSD